MKKFGHCFMEMRRTNALSTRSKEESADPLGRSPLTWTLPISLQARWIGFSRQLIAHAQQKVKLPIRCWKDSANSLKKIHVGIRTNQLAADFKSGF